jgi:hypothetical protein
MLAYSIIAMWTMLGVSALLTGATWIASTRAGATLLSGLAGGSLVLALASTAVWTWVLRDGLGADSVPTAGVLAFQQFGRLFSGPFFIACLGGGVVLTSWRSRVRAIERASGR